MTRAHTILTALLKRAIDAGEVEVRGTQLCQDGRPVMPQLIFVADQEPPTSTAAAARMAQQQPSPAEPLRQGREGAQRLRWPGNFAPLPPSVLTREDW